MQRYLIFTLLLVPALLAAQFKSQEQPVNMATVLRSTGEKAVGLIGLDPSKLHISHSYSMSMLSMGGQSATQGLYLNTLTYEFSAPLTVSLQWGMAHQPFGNTPNAPVLQNGPFLSGASLLYQPSKNTVLHFRFQRVPYHSNFYRGYSPFYFSE